MQLKPFLAQERRLNRFNADLSAEESGSRLRRLLKKSAKVPRKLSNLVVYEITSRTGKSIDKFRFRMLRGVLDRGRPASHSPKGLSVATVLALAGKEYGTQPRLFQKAKPSSSGPLEGWGPMNPWRI